MEMQILTGNVGSGKSLYAKLEAARTGAIVVNMDSIQAMVAGGDYDRYRKSLQPVYHAIEEQAITSALEAGISVIVDRTNMDIKTRARYIRIAIVYNVWTVSINWGPGTIEGLSNRVGDPRGVPRNTWDRLHRILMANTYEEPSAEEGFNTVIEGPLKYRFHAFDFDGTIVEHELPGIGKIIEPTVGKMQSLARSIENVIIIWTCRSGDYEAQARAFMRSNKIPFHFVNENPCFEMGGRKVFAHHYYDDRNRLLP